MSPESPAISALHIPSAPSLSDLGKLFAGGLVGLLLWEIWARGLTPLVTGGPLEPPQLIISLVKYWTGFTLSKLQATVLHYSVGIAGYPLAYWIVSRAFRGWGPVFDLVVWGLFTAFVVWMFLSGTGRTGTVLFWFAITALYATRLVNRNETFRAAISWGAFSWFNALGIMAPLAGLPFLLLKWGDALSFMSWGGHVIYGAAAVLVFEFWTRSKA